MPRAVLIGGTGLIGRAAARALARDGWEVVALSRSGELPAGLAELGVGSVVADRGDDAQLRAALGSGADVLYDSVAMHREHGEQLNALEGLVGSLVVISTASVRRFNSPSGLSALEMSWMWRRSFRSSRVPGNTSMK